MGFNYSFAGYSSAKDMFDSFCIDEYTQAAAFGRFIAAYDNGSPLSACQQCDFFEMAKIYNDTVQYGLIFTRYTIETTIPNTDALKQQIENLSDLFSFGEYEY